MNDKITKFLNRKNRIISKKKSDLAKIQAQIDYYESKLKQYNAKCESLTDNIRQLERDIESVIWEDGTKVIYRLSGDELIPTPLAPNYISIIELELYVKAIVPAIGRSKYLDELTIAYDKCVFEFDDLVFGDVELEIIKKSTSVDEYLKNTTYDLFEEDYHQILREFGYENLQPILLRIQGESEEFILNRLDIDRYGKEDEFLNMLQEKIEVSKRTLEYPGDWDDDAIIQHDIVVDLQIYIPIPKSVLSEKTIQQMISKNLPKQLSG